MRANCRPRHTALSGAARLPVAVKTATIARRRRRCIPPSSLFNGLSKMLGRKETAMPENPNQGGRSTLERIITGDSVKPVFPPYTVIRKTPEYSLRLYSVFPVVEMEYQRREEGYASLGGYIDGSNVEGARFAYSQPVVMCYYPDGRKVMQMFLAPRGTGGGVEEGGDAGAGSVASLPAPAESGLRLNVAGGEVVAVMQFEGYITPATAEAVRRHLTACLTRDGIRLAAADAGGRFRCAQYGAVYQLGDRLNEMMLQVEV